MRFRDVIVSIRHDGEVNLINSIGCTDVPKWDAIKLLDEPIHEPKIVFDLWEEDKIDYVVVTPIDTNVKPFFYRPNSQFRHTVSRQFRERLSEKAYKFDSKPKPFEIGELVANKAETEAYIIIGKCGKKVKKVELVERHKHGKEAVKFIRRDPVYLHRISQQEYLTIKGQ